MKEFDPPINQRSTNDLLNIVAAPDNWDLDALKQAESELNKRAVTQEQINNIKLLHTKKEQLEERKRANETYSIFDFHFHPLSTILEVLISWELKKDGYLRKAKQQRWLRLIFSALIFLLFIFIKKMN